jgi:acyl-CoA oxidase
MQLIHEEISQLNYLTDDEKAVLIDWSDPSKQPAEAQFREWVSLFREAAATLSDPAKFNLVDLGIAMAKRNSPDNQQRVWSDPEVRNSLLRIEVALGIEKVGYLGQIFPEIQLSQQKQVTERSFDPFEMCEILEGKYHGHKNRMRKLLQDNTFRIRHFSEKKEHRKQILNWVRHLAKQGLGSLSYPLEYGGKNDMGAYISALEIIGHLDLSLMVKFGVQFGLFGGSVMHLGTKSHHDKYLSATGQGELLGCFAMTETGHGSNVRDLKTTATYDSEKGHIVVHTPTELDGKDYIGNAMHSSIAAVFAQLIVRGTNHGVHAVLVPLRDSKGDLLDGIRIEDNGYKLGLNGVDNGRIWFNKVRVPVVNLLDRYGSINANGNYSSPIESDSRRFFTMLGTLVGGRVSVPKGGLSSSKNALVTAIRYALKRRQFAPKEDMDETILMDYPSHQRRLMPLLAKTYALHFALEDLMDKYLNHAKGNIREIESLAAGLKSYSTWFTTECIQECREACGGKGYLWENRFADLKADSDIFTTFEGDNTVLMQLVAKALLSDYRDEFSSDRILGIVRYLGTEVSDTWQEYKVITKRLTDSKHLQNFGFQLEAFEYRERRLLYSLANRMRRMLRKRIAFHDAYLRSQTHMLELAEAHIERIVLQSFQNKISDLDEGVFKDSLKLLCDLFALHTIEKNKGWYLENDYMEGAKTKAIRKLVDKLCKDLRLQALDFVDAFQIPDELIMAPIAVGDF